EIFGRNRLVVHGELALAQVQLRNLQRLIGKVDAFDPGAAPRHRLGEDPAAAADVERGRPGKLRDAGYPVQAQRIDLVERLELALRIPPAVRERARFLQFPGVGVHIELFILELLVSSCSYRAVTL